MTTAEAIYELVKKLPEDKASLVLKFTQSIQQEYVLSHVTANGTHQEDSQSWKRLVQELSGTWADFSTAEELRANVGQDVAREPF